MLRVGMVGVGGIARMHAEGILIRADLFKLMSACDSNSDALKNFTKNYGVSKAYADYRSVIEDPEIDAVIVLLPHDMHEQVCIEAFNGGKHVLLEKPIARTLKEADSIIEAAKASGMTLMIAHNERYFPVHQRIKQILDEGALGKIFCARADHYQNFDRPKDSWWRSKQRTGGGCVIGSGIHRLDILRWFLGEVDEVFAYQVQDNDRLEAEVACVATLRFRSGAIAEFFCNWGVYRSPVYESLSVFGKNGSLYLNDCEPFLMVNHREDPDNKLIKIPVDSSYQTMWEHFANCISDGITPLTCGAEGRKTLEIALAINRSAETGKPVNFVTGVNFYGA